MRFTLTLFTGMILGYVLYGKKDQTIEQLVNKAYVGLEKIDTGVRKHVTKITD